MSVGHLITLGLGTGTFSGSTSFIVTSGLSSEIPYYFRLETVVAKTRSMVAAAASLTETAPYTDR